MQVIKEMTGYGHEQILFVRDGSVGLNAIIAIHSTALGPALGGTRFWDYASEDDALFDVLRLSRGMTLKNAAAGLALGGGKAVIIGDPGKLKSREFFHAYARFIEQLGGIYYTAEDVNVNSSDVAHMREITRYVTGTPDVSGDPSPFTARGVLAGMKAGAKTLYGSDSLKGKTILVQGIGSVGSRLCELLAEEGAVLKINNRSSGAVERILIKVDAEVVPAEKLLSTACDIFAPCAMGAVLNTGNIKQLKCAMIAGAANNVLLDAATGDALEEMGILYLPDYIVNAGGVINCGMEIVKGKYDIDEVNAATDGIYETTLKIIELAKERHISTYQAADEFARSIISKS